MKSRFAMDELLQLAHWAAHKADEPALLAPDSKSISHGALHELVKQTRDAFRSAGVAERELVVLAMPQGLGAMVSFLAVAGEASCAPLDPSLTADEYLRYLRQLRAGVLVVEDEAHAAVKVARELGLLVLQMNAAFAVRVVYARTSGPGRLVDGPLVLLTSSTTGDPKLVPVSERNLAARLDSDVRALGLTEADRLLVVMPAFHAFGLQRSLAQLRCGGSVVIPPGFDSAKFGAWWRGFRPTWLAAGVPALHALAASATSVSARFVLVGGGTPEVRVSEAVERLVGGPVLVGYGSSETGPITRGRLAGVQAGCVGTPCGPEVRVDEGEILLRGDGVFAGYLDDAAANQDAFRDGWFRTGDLGHLDDGLLFLTGRIKELISRGSEKIRPVEIDQILMSHPAVEDAASFPIPHPTLGDDVAAAVVLCRQITDVELRRFVGERLAAFKVPRLIVFVDAIPRTASGKPKRAVLSERYRDQAPVQREELREADRQAAATLLEIWGRTLGTPVPSGDHDFAQLGGDSLSAARMLAEVDAVFHANGQVMKRADFFDEPTVGTLVRIVSECSADVAAIPGILNLSVNSGSGEPVFFFPGWRGRQGGPVDPYYLRHLAAGMGNRLHVVTASIPQQENARPVEELARESIVAMRAVRATGPYAVAGHCLGAVVAFEVARQLKAAGEGVARVLLFDAVAPGYPKMEMSPSKALAEVLRIVTRLDWREGWSHVHSFGRLLHQRFAGKADAGTNNFRGIALWQYQPKPSEVPLVHFIAADHPVSRVVDDPRYGWREYGKAGVEFQPVPGDHDSMFDQENARGLARLLLEKVA
ncbi:MAG: AMP-binding protein [Bryobacteraceae bacterium]